MDRVVCTDMPQALIFHAVLRRLLFFFFLLLFGCVRNQTGSEKVFTPDLCNSPCRGTMRLIVGLTQAEGLDIFLSLLRLHPNHIRSP